MLITQYIKLYLLEFARNKTAVVFTVIFPSIMLLMYRSHIPTDPSGQWEMLISMANYAVQCALFQTLGMQFAFSKERTWSQYCRILPVTVGYAVWGRILTMTGIACLSLALTLITGFCLLPINLEFYPLSVVTIIALLGGIPMGLLAIYLASWVSSTSARSVFVIANLLFFFAAIILPDQGWLASVKNALPSYQWLSLSCLLATQQKWDLFSLSGLIAYTLLFYVLILHRSRKLRV